MTYQLNLDNISAKYMYGIYNCAEYPLLHRINIKYNHVYLEWLISVVDGNQFY